MKKSDLIVPISKTINLRFDKEDSKGNCYIVVKTKSKILRKQEDFLNDGEGIVGEIRNKKKFLLTSYKLSFVEMKVITKFMEKLSKETNKK